MFAVDVATLVVAFSYFPFFVLGVVGFARRRHIPMLRARLPLLLSLSMVGGVGQLLLVVLGILVRPHHATSCAIFRWVGNISYTTLIVPFYLRGLFLFFLFREQAKATSTSDVHLTSLPPPTSQTRRALLDDTPGTVPAPRHLTERFWLEAFGWLMIPVLVGSAVEELISPKWSSTERGCVKGRAENALYVWLALHALEAVGFTLMAFLVRRVHDAFSINVELRFIATVGAGVAIVLCAFIAREEESHETRESIVALLFALRVVALFVISVAWPLYRSFYPRVVMFHQVEVLSSLERVLRDPLALSHFRMFLAREGSVEGLLFWMEVELLRDMRTASPGVLLDEAKGIYFRYLSPEGATFPVKVKEELLTPLAEELLHGRAWPEMFTGLQSDVLRTLRDEFFPRFLGSPACADLLHELHCKETVRNRLMHGGLVGVSESYMYA